MQVVATKIHDRQLAFLFGGREKDEKIFLQLVHQGIGKILASMKQYYNITLSASIGKTCNRLTDISQSWQSAITVWKGMYNGEKSILFYPAIIGETDTVLHTQIHHEIKENKNLLRYAICDAREKEAYIIFEKLMKCYTMLPFQKTNYIIASLEEFLFDLGEDIEHLGFKSIVEKINEAKKMMERESLFDIKQMMEKYIHIYCDMIKNFSLTQRTDLQAVKQALRYIDDHLQDSQLSAELVAKQLMFSTSYFRQIFRKMTNESFNEYLIQKRMARAAVLLKNNQMIKIQNLAEMCGYENQRYFASSFKKYYGCTPTEYKEECLENLSAEVGHVI
jgi:two-component system response regulator YesN